MSVNATDVFSQLGIRQQTSIGTPRKTELGEDDFLRLMTEQLKNQDPLKPLGSTEFLGQLAQFSTVKGIQQLSTNMQGVGSLLGESQALQAAGMVGRDVYLDSDHGTLAGPEGIDGATTVTAAGPVTVTVTDASGQVVRTMTVTATAAGNVDFHWDGMSDNGSAAAPGEYTFKATAGGTALTTQIAARIDSISYTAQGIVLNVRGHGAVTFDQISRIS